VTTVLLLDGHSLAYRAFYALPVGNFATTTGQPTNAVYGFTSMLINMLRDEQPDQIVVAFDVSRTTFRTEQFPAYKATRSASPEEFKGQVGLIQEVLKALGIAVVACDGFEADDVIATLAEQGTSKGSKVLIVTGDRDAFQLVSPEVTVLYPKKGVSDLARMTPEAVEERYGLTPAQYPDYAALRGDPSDNLPGIPGVGEKTAAKWIREYGSLAGLIDNVDTVPGKAGDALRGALDQVLMNRHLTQLRVDAPVGLSLDDCELQPWDLESVDQLFDALQFRALRERLLAQNRGETPVAVAAVHIDAEVVPAAQVATWLASLVSPSSIAFGGTWGRGTGTIDTACLVDAAGTTGVIDCEVADSRDAFYTWLADPTVAKQGHNLKGPALAVIAKGSCIAGITMDTALAAYLAAPDQRSYALGDVVGRVLGRQLTVSEQAEQLSFDDDSGVAHQELAQQAQAIAELATALGEVIDREGVRVLLTDVELPLTGLLSALEHTGIAVDMAGLAGLSTEFGEAMRQAEERSHEIVGRPFNLGSPKQLQEILFTDLNLPKTKKIKTGYTTDADALQSLFATTQHPLLEQLLIWRDRSKLRQTVDGLVPLADAHHRIHTTFNQTVAATGRLSSADPNLQNIPVRTEEGRRIRNCFVVGDGYEFLMTADYSQIEMRIMAHASNDAGLIAAFKSGEDLHTTVASQVFGVPAGSVDAEMRRRIKAMSYGLAYGLSAFGLSQQLGIYPDEARGLMEEYFTRFGGVRDYLAKVVQEARLNGYTQTMFGRRRYLPDLNSDNRQRREMAERMALNAPIQGTAADIMKIAMLRVDTDMRAAGLGSRMLLQVHDELVLEVVAGESEALEAIVRAAMAEAADLTVPLDVSVGVGRSWHEAAH
jgi:DNA polymerase-1